MGRSSTRRDRLNPTYNTHSLFDPDDRKYFLEAVAWAFFAHNPFLLPDERLSYILKVRPSVHPSRRAHRWRSTDA